MISFPKPDVEQFLRTFAIGDFAVSPDEKQLVFSTNLSGKYNLWALDLPKTFPYPLTFIDQSCQGLLYDKQGRFIIAGFDQDGDENTQFYGLPLQGGTMKEIVYQENTRNFMPILSENGKKLYYTSSKDNPMCLSSYCLDLDSGQETKVIEGQDAATYLLDFSPDESTFLYYKHFANTYTLVFAKHGDEEIRLTPPTEKQHTVSDAVFVSNDLVYLLTDYESDFTYLASYDLKTRTFLKIKSLEKESLRSLKYNKFQQTLYISSEKGVEDFLYEYSLQDGNWNKVSTPCSVIEKLVVSKAGTLYLLGRSATTPHNIYKREENEWVSLTKYTVPGVAPEELVDPDVITYRSFDDLEIEALFFKAKKENDNGEIIFWPHGGPQAAERKFFRASFQFFLNQGFSIFAPNFRGSTGYGLAFTKMVEGDWGNGPRLDNVAGLDWLIENGYAEKGSILLMGGSFGGYMSLLLHGRHADYFKAVVDIFGPSDLFSFINSVPDDWKPVMDQWVGNPERDKEKLIEYSPITYLDGMTKPMLVIQGANDPRVVQQESDQIVAALREKGREVEYMLLTDEGHGFSKKENEIAVYQRILSFFNQFIGSKVKG
ncbi:prolyl oligopeptidase family serine peptidase [Heyndrickxia oleronia]|uniref:Prolyl oligopeptidase family serine peptidase n=1 Tax=Heyndrickxia oleronia TaxID=38875 RepID=A0AAW6SV29_9BACI|nr:prolyl oligopeptidase family serine peptidase [Heyndrickxia oleronia]MCM3238625.1 prolyl oligopeptidase family serine peptidase [Heyndrickxia oleronia]MDH5162138.1 prolyl oligopeptidase family serine peptidase [Heyndrickxia oleronia]